MKCNNIIELKDYRQPEPFDFAAYNQRAASRYRNSLIRGWIMHTIESIVTLAIGICMVFSMYLVLTML